MRILLIGGGEVLGYVARRARSPSNHLTLVLDDPQEATRLARELEVTVVAGDGTDPSLLQELDTHLADLVVAMTPRDQDNLVICQVARRFFEVERTVALVNDPDNGVLFRRLGIDRVVSVAEILGGVVRQASFFDGIVSSLALAGGDLSLVEVRLSTEAPAAGSALREISLPEGALIAGVLRAGGVIIPRGDTRLLPGDEILLLSTADSLKRALAAISGTAG